MSKRNPKPTAKVKDTNNLGDLKLRSHQEAHNQAAAIANLTSDMPSSNDTSSKRKPAPEVGEAEEEGNQPAQAPNTSSIFAQCSFSS